MDGKGSPLVNRMPVGPRADDRGIQIYASYAAAYAEVSKDMPHVQPVGIE